jgi:cephalosporin hydroxylase
MSIFQRANVILKNEGLGGLIGMTARAMKSESGLLYQSIVIPVAVNEVAKKFKEESVRPNGVDELVDFALNFSYMGISAKPVQNRKEIVELCKILEARKIHSLMEIGTDMGGTLFLISRMAEPDATVISVNLPYSRLDAWCMKYRTHLYHAFAVGKQKFHLLTANSHESGTVRMVEALISGGLDFLFIDGDHSYEGVKKDFEMYSPLVKKGGLIGFHDISKNDTVGRYWNEVKKDYKHQEIEHTKGPGLGIGLVYV